MKLTLIEYSYCCVTATIALIININRHVGSGKWDVVNDPYSGYKLTCSDSEDFDTFSIFHYTVFSNYTEHHDIKMWCFYL